MKLRVFQCTGAGSAKTFPVEDNSFVNSVRPPQIPYSNRNGFLKDGMQI